MTEQGNSKSNSRTWNRIAKCGDILNIAGMVTMAGFIGTAFILSQNLQNTENTKRFNEACQSVLNPDDRSFCVLQARNDEYLDHYGVPFLAGMMAGFGMSGLGLGLGMLALAHSKKPKPPKGLG